MDETFYSVNQVAILFKVHPLTVRRYIKEGKLKAVKVAGNIRISKSSTENFTKDLDPSQYEAKKPIATTSSVPAFTLDDPIFRLKARGLSLRTFST